MVDSDTTPRRSARSSPRVSSTKSTPQANKSTKRASTSTPLKQSTTATTPISTRSGRSIKPTSVASPYFSDSKKKTTKNGGGKARSNANANAKATTKRSAKPTKVKVETSDNEDGEGGGEEREHSPTGMTESEPPSSTDDSDSEDAFDPSSDEDAEEEEELVEDEAESEVDSDFLDEEEDAKKSRKRNSAAAGGGGGAKKKVKLANGNGDNGSVGVKRKSGTSGGHGIEGYEDEDDDEDIELEEGQEIAGRIYPAPKTGQVPPGRISRNTLNFLKNLQIPERNDRDWFRSHEPAFRQAEKEWVAFVGLVQSKFHEADDEIPHLPPKDIIHRIYRDVRFSSDKTPYKRGFSMTTSRGGRKGIWACYHLSIAPNDRSILACGLWQPGKNEMATIRHNLLADPQRFRDVIGEKQFVKMFGEANEKKGKRQNVFGHEDALKVAPKGVEKNHKDIDLLKLRSVAVVHTFRDEEVLDENFQEKIKDVVQVMVPFVRLLNEFVSLPADNGNGAGDDD